jgi:hypothetical protein
MKKLSNEKETCDPLKNLKSLDLFEESLLAPIKMVLKLYFSAF